MTGIHKGLYQSSIINAVMMLGLLSIVWTCECDVVTVSYLIGVGVDLAHEYFPLKIYCI